MGVFESYSFVFDTSQINLWPWARALTPEASHTIRMTIVIAIAVVIQVFVVAIVSIVMVILVLVMTS